MQLCCRPAQISTLGHGNWWRKLLSSEAKTTVRAIPVEARAEWTSVQWLNAMLGGGCLFGIGSLCYYGLGQSNETGATDEARFWPKEVRQRVNRTYGFFAYGLATIAAAAYVTMRSTSVVRFMAARPYASGALSLIGSIGSYFAVQSIPYTLTTLPAKVGAFTVLSSILGAAMAPLSTITGPLVARAALYTAGLVGGLTLTAACAPSVKYLSIGGPLTLGINIVFGSIIGSLFASPGGAVFSAINEIYLILLEGFVLYDTQRIIHRAQYDTHYDPISRSIGIYLGAFSIFNIFLTLLARSGNGNS